MTHRHPVASRPSGCGPVGRRTRHPGRGWPRLERFERLGSVAVGSQLGPPRHHVRGGTGPARVDLGRPRQPLSEPRRRAPPPTPSPHPFRRSRRSRPSCPRSRSPLQRCHRPSQWLTTCPSSFRGTSTRPGPRARSWSPTRRRPLRSRHRRRTSRPDRQGRRRMLCGTTCTKRTTENGRPPPSYDYLFGHTTTADEHRKALAQLTQPDDEDGGSDEDDRLAVPTVTDLPDVPVTNAAPAPEVPPRPIPSVPQVPGVAELSEGGLISSVPWASPAPKAPQPAPQPEVPTFSGRHTPPPAPSLLPPTITPPPGVRAPEATPLIATGPPPAPAVPAPTGARHPARHPARPRSRPRPRHTPARARRPRSRPSTCPSRCPSPCPPSMSGRSRRTTTRRS